MGDENKGSMNGAGKEADTLVTSIGGVSKSLLASLGFDNIDPTRLISSAAGELGKMANQAVELAKNGMQEMGGLAKTGDQLAINTTPQGIVPEAKETGRG